MNVETGIRREGLRDKLKAATRETHERLDRRIMSARAFDNRDRYTQFVRVQYRFHGEIDRLFSDPTLLALIPDIKVRRRLGLIAQDLADLGCAAPPVETAASRPEGADRATALGWLYVAEGSNLGAAFLSKEAVKLGLSDTFGARHLAAHPDGRGPHWRRFTIALDAAALSGDEQERVVAGANSAFRRVHALVEEFLST